MSVPIFEVLANIKEFVSALYYRNKHKVNKMLVLNNYHTLDQHHFTFFFVDNLKKSIISLKKKNGFCNRRLSNHSLYTTWISLNDKSSKCVVSIASSVSPPGHTWLWGTSVSPYSVRISDSCSYFRFGLSFHLLPRHKYRSWV